MTTTAQLGSLTLIKRGDGASPEVFTTIYECTKFGPLGQDNPLKDATHMLSTAKEYIYGLADGMEVPLTVQYKSTDLTHIGLLADNASKTTRNFKVTLPAGLGATSFTFAALVKSWNINFAPDEIVDLNFTLKISGAITGPV